MENKMNSGDIFLVSNSQILVTDNDSGYVSQNVESNSLDMNDINKPIISASHVFLNEDTLMENPLMESIISENCDLNLPNYEATTSDVIPASVSSHGEHCKLFESDESGISDTSIGIPVLDQIVVSSENLIETINKSETNQEVYSEQDLSLQSENFKCFEETSQNESVHSLYEDSKLSSIQDRLLNANNCSMSLFESFYSFVCDLYSIKDGAFVSLPTTVTNENNTSTSDENCSTVSYLELESRSENSQVCIDPDEYLNKITPLPLQDDLANNSKLSKIENDIKRITKLDTGNTNSVSSAISTTASINCTSTLNSNCKNKTPTKCLNKSAINPELSPEVFSEDESAEMLMCQKKPLPQQKMSKNVCVTETDKKLLKHAQESVTGVPPPPSLRILQISVDDMLRKINENKHLLLLNKENSENNEENRENYRKKESFLIRNLKEDFKDAEWPDIMNYRFHGLMFNRSKLSEDFENVCTKYAERCIGAETHSSCTVFGFNAPQSPSKSRYRKKVLKSPGRRLSHLARRRITFTKDSLNTSVSVTGGCSFIGARTRQIMVDVRKQVLPKRKSPKKRTPRKTPFKSPRKSTKTPSSSNKKRNLMKLRLSKDISNDSIASTSKASSTKRALFQSPQKENGETKRRTPRRALFSSPIKTSPYKSTISSLYSSHRALTPKRVLFTSPEKSKLSALEVNDKKRKRENSESGESLTNISSKTTPSSISSEIKSQLTARFKSSSQDIVDNRKKKLMWTVAEALRSQGIDMKHPQFKVFASVLARVIRHFLPNLFINTPRPTEGSTTESMLRIAKKYVFYVTRGKTVDQIIKEAENEKLKNFKPIRSMGLEKILEPRDMITKSKDNVLQDRLNIMSNSSNEESGSKHSGRRPESVERIRKVINFEDSNSCNR